MMQLREQSDNMLLLLHKILLLSYEQSEIPTEMLLEVIRPIFKGGGKQPHLPSSFRPVALTSNVAKVFERIILRKICDRLGIADIQAGYRRGRSTTDHVLTLTNRMLKSAANI